MSYCKHDWQRRNEVLREVFGAPGDTERVDFYVCCRCLKIDQVRREHERRADPDRAADAA